MGIVLGPNRYGKAESRVVRIYRDTPRHEIRDLNVSTMLRGDFTDAHVTGDQAHVLPTDTQKNTAFAYAKEHGVTSPEDYALALGRRLLTACAPAAEAWVRVEEQAWDRIPSRSDEAGPRPRVRTTRHGAADDRGRRRGDDDGHLRPHRPGAPQVDRVGVPGLPARRVHDPARRRRPDPGDVAHRELAARRPLPTGTGRTTTGTRRTPPCGPCSSRRSRRRTASPCSTPCTPWAGPRSRPTTSWSRSRSARRTSTITWST